MTCTFISRFRIKPDKTEAFVALARQAEDLVREHEPDCLRYEFYRLRDPGMFAVIESFVDEAADIAHQKAPYMAPLIGDIVACMDGEYVREYLDRI